MLKEAEREIATDKWRERERARQGVGVERGGWYRAASQSTHYAN